MSLIALINFNIPYVFNYCRFVVDEKGLKMSKSLGNVVSPMDIIDGGSNQKESPAMGADTLRLWISGVDYTGDVCIGSNIIKQVSDSYRKLRNTLRYLIGNLNDFNLELNGIPLEELPSLDKYILGKLTSTVEEVEKGYESYQFYKVNSAITQFAVSDLSAFYLDIAKDRLYISSKNDKRRRSCQTVLFHLLDQMTLLLAPILPHMAEDVWQNIPFETEHSSVFEKGWISASNRFPSHENSFWDKIRLLRNDVNRCLELARQSKEAGAPQEVQVLIHSTDEEWSRALAAIQGDTDLLSPPKGTNGVDDLRFVLLTSQVHVVKSVEELGQSCPKYRIFEKDSESGASVGVTKASGHKCDRCWYYSPSVGHDTEHPEICPRCADAVRVDGYVVSDSE